MSIFNGANLSSPIRFKWRSFAVTMIGAAIAFNFRTSPVMGASPQDPVQPYYVERELWTPGPDGGPLRPTSDEVVARRSDGATVVVSRFGSLSSGIKVRQLTLPGGIESLLTDDLRLKSTFPPLTELEVAARNAEMRKVSTTCTREPGPTPAFTQFLNRKVVAVQTATDKYRFVHWRSGDFGCEWLHYTSERKGPDNSYVLTVEGKARRADLREPDPALFDPRPEYTEVRPSVMLARMVESLNATLTTQEQAIVRRTGEMYDLKYSGTLDQHATGAKK